MRFLLCRVAIFVVLPLSPLSNRVTHGQPALFRRASQGKQHTVTLTWKASPSRVAGYNVYRKTAAESDYRKINSSLVEGITYKDNTVERGVTYHYAVRAVDAQGRESVNSTEFTIAVPQN
jgi:fibronectin type 3 domain-containing protein